LQEAREVVQQADDTDKAVAKAKRKEKMWKRKERERLEEGGAGGAGGVAVDGEAEDLLENFRKDAGFGDESEGEERVQKKKPKKWFQQDSDDEQASGKKRKTSKGKGTRHADDAEQPQTLEDLERMAAGLLG
jgi:ATP-dependent RNA helicase DDX10/DBP4